MSPHHDMPQFTTYTRFMQGLASGKTRDYAKDHKCDVTTERYSGINSGVLLDHLVTFIGIEIKAECIESLNNTEKN